MAVPTAANYVPHHQNAPGNLTTRSSLCSVEIAVKSKMTRNALLWLGSIS
jgi:hypothetical protein